MSFSRVAQTVEEVPATLGAAPRRETRWRPFLTRWTSTARRLGSLGLGRSTKLRARFAKLHQHERALAEFSATVEKKFLAIGESLQTQASVSGQLVTHSARLSALAVGDTGDGASTARAAKLVQEFLEFTEETRRHTGALIGKVEGYHQQIGRLLYEEQRVERIVAPLRVIQTLFRIESAVLPVDVQLAFIALSGEIPKFEAKVREAFAQHSEQLTRTRGEIVRTATRLREAAAQQAETTAATRERTGETLAALGRDLEESRVRDTRLAALVNEIDHEASAVVVSLQYQDITRQKMEHVRKALEEIAARAQAGGRFRGPADLPYLHQACRLEALQSEAIHDELDRAVTTLLGGVRGIVGRLQQIDRECRPHAGRGRAADAVGQRMQGLKDALQQAEALVPQALQGADDALALLGSFGDVAASVASAASEMAEDMRMIALNAQVQAAQAGEAGAGLLILAERTYLISEEIKLVTRNIGAEFAEAARLLADAKEEGGWLRQQTEARRHEMTAGAKRVREELDRDGAETGRTLHQLEELLVQLEQLTAQVLPELEVGEASAAPLFRLRDDLVAIAASLEPFVGAEVLNPADAEAFATVRRRYTMEAERAVHAAALAQTDSASSATTETVAAGGNVELF